MTRQESFNRLRRLIVLVMLGCLMFLSDFLMEFLPNIHLVGVLIVAYTRVYRGGALIAVYVYVFLNGLYGGFATWWIPYLYVWTVLWAGVMLLPRRLPRKAGNVVCTVFATNVFDNLVTATVTEVNIKVGHADSLRIKERLK